MHLLYYNARACIVFTKVNQPEKKNLQWFALYTICCLLMSLCSWWHFKSKVNHVWRKWNLKTVWVSVCVCLPKCVQPLQLLLQTSRWPCGIRGSHFSPRLTWKPHGSAVMPWCVPSTFTSSGLYQSLVHLFLEIILKSVTFTLKLTAAHWEKISTRWWMTDLAHKQCTTSRFTGIKKKKAGHYQMALNAVSGLWWRYNPLWSLTRLHVCCMRLQTKWLCALFCED